MPLPQLPKHNRGAYKFYGNHLICIYGTDKIYKELAFIGYYFHWGWNEMMELNHLERIRWCNEISKINKDLNNEQDNIFDI